MTAAASVSDYPGHESSWAVASLRLRTVLTGEKHNSSAVRRHLAPALQAKGYQLKRAIGKGGYGLVYEAQCTKKPARRVAVKVAQDSRMWADTCHLEACVTRSCGHPNIVRVHEIIYDACLYVMELCDGNMQTLIAAQKEWVEMERVHMWFGQCVSALTYLHAKGVIHGDIKTENILHRDGTDVLKLCDLGMMRYEGCRDDQTSLCTFMYTPPELILGRGCTTKATDIWALGIVGLEMLELWRSMPHMATSTPAELYSMQCRRFGTPTPETWPGVDWLCTHSVLSFQAPAPPSALRLIYNAAIAEAPPPLSPQLAEGIGAALTMCPAGRPTAPALLNIVRGPPKFVKRPRSND